MAKKRREYTADEMKALKEKLSQRRFVLAAKIMEAAETYSRAPDFDLAVTMRDDAQQLVSAQLALDGIGDSISLAEHTGKPRYLPFKLEDCGLSE